MKKQLCIGNIDEEEDEAPDVAAPATPGPDDDEDDLLCGGGGNELFVTPPPAKKAKKAEEEVLFARPEGARSSAGKAPTGRAAKSTVAPTPKQCRGRPQSAAASAGAAGDKALPPSQEVAEPDDVNLVAVWSIEDFHKFLIESQEKIVEAEFKAMEIQKAKQLLDAIPVDVRKHYGLPSRTGEYDVAVKNAGKTVEKIEAATSATIEAYMNVAETNMRKASCQFCIDSGLEAFGALSLLAQHPNYLTNKEDVLHLLWEHENAADDSAKAEFAQRCSALQKLVLKEQVMDFATANLMWSKCVAFTQKHYRAEPSKEQLRQFLALVNDKDLRDALGLMPEEKFGGKLRPRGWSADITRLITITYLAYTAWHE